MKIIFAGTPIFATKQLQALLDNAYDVVAVLTQPDSPIGRGRKLAPSPVKELALEHNLPVQQPLSLRDHAIQNYLHSLQADFMIVSAYGLLLPKEILTLPQYGCLNIHASLLPRWRGAAPIQYAILAGDQKTGITIMQMTQGLDTGPILYQTSIKITETDTSATITHALAQLGAESIITVLKKYPPGPFPIIQDDRLATLAPKIQKKMAQIQWAQHTIAIYRTICAYNPWPVAFSFLDEIPIRIWAAEPIMDEMLEFATPGTILPSKDRRGLLVRTQDGALLLTILQLPGKCKMPTKILLHSKKAFFAPGKQFIFNKSL